MPAGANRAAGALALLLLAGSVIGQMSPAAAPGFYPAGGCSELGAGQLVCTGALTDYDVTAALDDVLYYASNGYSPTLVFRNANITNLRISALSAFAFNASVSPLISLKFEDCEVAGNQVLAFGALAAQANLAVDVSVSGSRIAGNMLTAAAALAVGGAGTLSLSVQDSEVVGNMVSAAGALAVANTATVRASGSGGGAADNTVAAAGFVASGGPAAAAAAMQIPGANNVVLGAGLPFTEQQLVAAIVRTVMDSVFVSSSGLNAGLANVQTQLCLGMAPGGAIRGWVEGALYDAGFVSDVVNIANGVLCGANPLRLSDIPGMAASDDGGALGFKSLLALATGQGHLGLKSAWGMAKAMAAHPGAVGAFMSQLQVVPAGAAK